MLGVLIKHEIRQTYKTLLEIAGAVATVTLVSGLVIHLRLPLLEIFGVAAALAALAALPWSAIGFFIWRYYQSMYGRNGYFTMSLPVRGRQLFWAKIGWGLIVAVLSFLLMGLGWMWLAGVHSGFSLIEQARQAVDGLGWSTVIGVVAFGAVAVVSTIMQLAFAITYGSGPRLNRFGVGGPALVVAIMWLVGQILALVAIMFIPLGVEITDQNTLGQIVWKGTFQWLSESGLGHSVPRNGVLGLGFILVYIVLAVVSAIGTIRCIDRHTCLR